MSLPRSRARIAIVAVAVVAVLATVLLMGRDDAASAQAESSTQQLDTAEVVRTDLIEDISFDGSIGLLESSEIVATLDGIVTDLAPVDSVLETGDMAYAVDGVTVPVLVGDTILYRDLLLGDSPQSVVAGGGGMVTEVVAVGTTIEQGDVLFHLDGEPVVALYGDVSLNRTLAVAEQESSTSYASDVQSAQNREDLVEAIAQAEADRDEANASVPGTALLEAIDNLTRLTNAGADADEISSANRQVASAQQADLDRLEAADEAVARAQEALIDFDERQAASALDEAAAAASRVASNQTGNDVLAIETALAALGYDPDGAMTIDREFTSATAAAIEALQADIGAPVTGELDPSAVVFISADATVLDAVDDRTAVMTGAQVLTLSGGDLLVGEDVRMLENTLFDAGIELEPDDVFDEATLAGVIAWQEATGQVVDGVVSPTDVVRLDDPVQVTDHPVERGDESRSGTAVLSVSSTERFVIAQIPARDQEVMQVGLPVRIELPDYSEITGVVTSMASVASTPAAGETFFEASIDLDDPSEAAHLNEAPVEVIVVESEIVDAMAVPVTALLALAEGGYAVELMDGATTRLVAVTPGFYADGLVEIRSGELSVGDLVTVP